MPGMINCFCFTGKRRRYLSRIIHLIETEYKSFPKSIEKEKIWQQFVSEYFKTNVDSPLYYSMKLLEMIYHREDNEVIF
jgi:hypothetical protein